MERLTYLEGFESAVRRYPRREAIVTLDGRSYSYRELSDRSASLAAALEARVPGRRCAVLADNGVEVVEAMLAAMRRGRANVQLSTRGAVGELASAIETTDAAGLVFDGAHAETAAALVDRCSPEATIAIDGEGGAPVGAALDEVEPSEARRGSSDRRSDGVEPYADAVADADPADAPASPATDPPESAAFFTSGTTSAPKGILVDGQQAWLAAVQPAMEMGIDATDRALVCTPWYHMVTSEAWILPHLLVGATLVVQPTFDAEGALRAVEEHDVSGVLAVPTQLEALVAAQSSLGADLGSLEYVRTGGAIVPEALVERVDATLEAAVFNTYGLTEGVGNLTFAYPHEQDDHPGTIGKASYLWEVRVVEPADPPAKPDPTAEVEPGALGEVIGRSLQMTDGYLDRPEETEALFVDDPAGEAEDAADGAGGAAGGASEASAAGSAARSGRWLRTGDVARVDDDGYLVIIDRIDNMILSGGENIYPEEVQRALEEHPAVRAAGVVGLPDEKWGEMVAAAVVASEDVDEAELERHCRAHDTLADFKRPRRYRFVDDLPRSPTGTLLRGEVAALFDD